MELDPTNAGTLTDLGIFLGERRGAVALAIKMLRKVLEQLRQQGVEPRKLRQAVSLRVCPPDGLRALDALEGYTRAGSPSLAACRSSKASRSRHGGGREGFVEAEVDAILGAIAGLEWNPADVFDEDKMEKSRSSRIMAYGFSVEDDLEACVTKTSALGEHYYFMLKVMQSFQAILRIQSNARAAFLKACSEKCQKNGAKIVSQAMRKLLLAKDVAWPSPPDRAGQQVWGVL